MTNPETATLKRVMLAATRRGWRLFRNNVGVAQYPNGQAVKYGLAPGSSDLVGWRSVTVTPDMIGEEIAQFVAVEVKAPQGRLRANQRRWLNAVEAAGGVAIVARGAEDLEATDAT